MAIHGIGIDIIEIARIREAIRRHPRFLERVFTEREIAYCNGRARPEVHFAGRFAAKEAVAKSLGLPLSWHDVEILPDSTGKPEVVLSGRAVALGTAGTMLVSISHSHHYAVAQAVFVTEEGAPEFLGDESW